MPNPPPKSTDAFSVRADEPSPRLDSYLSKALGKSRTFIQEHIRVEGVLMNGALTKKVSLPVSIGDLIQGNFPQSPTSSYIVPEEGQIELIHEDEHLLAINKAAGVVVHPGAGNQNHTLISHVLHYLSDPNFAKLSPERPGIVHRLDVGTSGVILVAKTARCHELLSLQFKNRTIKKTYRALVWGKLSISGRYESSIGRDPNNRKKMSSKSTSGRIAITRWMRLKAYKHFSYVELYPETGRTHQLRVHLSEASHPILGDLTYGRKVKGHRTLDSALLSYINQLKHTLLHAYALNFSHPITQHPLQLVAKLPDDFTHCLALLEQGDM